jgi:membrane-associated tyrosine/threonine-specific cdc2-inhibitory kinase
MSTSNTILNGFPLPDFGSDDDFIVPSSPISRNCTQELTEAEYRELCLDRGLVVENLTPIKCSSNSAVYSARSSSDGSTWAIKVTDRKRRIAQEFTNRAQITDSPYLLKSIALQQSPTKAMIQMELCDAGDIRHRKFSEKDLWKLVHEISTALAIIHGSNCIHLDISPGNILIGPNCFKLADFATLTHIGSFRTGMEGAGPYVSPEALNFPHSGPVTGQTDIFSLGLVLLEAATGNPAPRGGSPGYIMIRNGQLKLGIGKYICECSQQLIDTVNSMLDPNPSNRPTSQQLASIKVGG